MKLINKIILVFLIFLNHRAYSLSFSNDYMLQEILLQSQNKKNYYFETKKESKYINLNLNLEASSNLEDLAEQFDMENEESIINYLNNSFGERYFVKTNNYFGFKYKRLKIDVSTSGGAVLDVNNPISPEVSGTIVHDKNVNLSYLFKYNNVDIIPMIVLGERKIYNQRIRISDFLKEEDFLFDWDSNPYENFSDFNILANYKYKRLKIQTSLEGVPLTSRDFNYWRWNIGTELELNNFYKFFNKSFIKVTPLYSGTFNHMNLIELGYVLSYDHWINYSLVYQNRDLSHYLLLDFNYLSLQLFHKKYNISEINNQNESIGFNLNLQY